MKKVFGRKPVGFGRRDDGILPQQVNENGEQTVELIDREGNPHVVSVAEAVLKSFVGPAPEGAVVHYKDGDKSNCKLDNLEWRVK